MDKAAIKVVFKSFGSGVPDRTRFVVDGEADNRLFIFSADDIVEVSVVPGKRGRHERLES
jgi:hypothetical protein